MPLLTRIYPNGKADVNHFAAAGGMGFLIGTLLDHGLLHGDVSTVWGKGLAGYRVEASLQDDQLVYRPSPEHSHDTDVLRPASNPFQATGGLKLLQVLVGNRLVEPLSL